MRWATPLGTRISSHSMICMLLFDTSQTLMLPILQSSETYTSQRFSLKQSREYLEEKAGMLTFEPQSHSSQRSGQQPILIGHLLIGGP